MTEYATEYVAVCTGCGALKSLVTVNDQWVDGKAVGGHWECEHCGHWFGVWINGGTIDLEAARENVLGSASTFEVFTDPPPG